MKKMPNTVKQIDVVSGHRLPELDGVRGIAIFLVLIWHYVQNQIQAQAGSQLAEVRQLLGFTWSGVDLFFVLSGFLIAGILLDNSTQPNYFRVFYIRRICRIFPLYYINIGLFLLFMMLHVDDIYVFRNLFSNNDVPLWTYFTFTQNIAMGLNNSAGVGWFAVTWSLAVEEQFYLLFPLIVRFVPYRSLPLIFMLFVIMAIILRYAVLGLSAYIDTPWRVDSLMIGALLAYYCRKTVFISLALKHNRLVEVAFVVSVVCAVVINLGGGFRLGGAMTHIYLALMYGLLIVCVVVNKDGFVARTCRMRWLIWLGSVSYGVYIFHTVVSRLVHGVIRDAPPAIQSFSDAATTFLALVLTLCIAQLSYLYIERRFIRYGHAYEYGDRK